MEDPMNLDYAGIPGWLILTILWVIGLSLFFKQVAKATKLIRLGGPDDRKDNFGARTWEWLTGWLGQKKVMRDRVVGTMHVMIFWGFLMIGSDVFDLSSGGRFENLIIAISPMLADLWNGMVEVGY